MEEGEYKLGICEGVAYVKGVKRRGEEEYRMMMKEREGEVGNKERQERKCKEMKEKG